MSTSDHFTHITNPEIRKNRMAQAVITVLRADGTPLANQELVLAQTSHQFLFGCSWFDLPLANGELTGEKKALAEQRAAKFTALCNYATLPFYWARFEPQRGQPQTERLMNLARWCRERQLAVKGHPLCWHTLTADWLLAMDGPQILQAQTARIQRDVTAFRGAIEMWDVINEAVIMPIFDKYANGLTRLCKELGRIKTIQAMFAAARAANPTATLVLNDFDVSPAYDILVEGCLAAGLQMDVIGIQTHMHQGYWGVAKTQQVLEHFERFHLPIHFTETTLVSGHLMPPEIVDLNDYQVDAWPTTPAGEDRQAQEVLQHYQALFAHPLVEGITWWDFSDGGWLKAPAGLVRQDGSSKPAYEALLKLVKGEWWLPPTRFSTDGAGQVHLTGFRGDYELEYAGQKRPFSLHQAGTHTLVVQL